MKKTAVVLLTVALLFSPIANAKKRGRCITEEADDIFESLRPLTKSCSRIGPASARWDMTSLWNEFSHEQQQQLMDQVATSQAIQAAQVAIHVYVYSTEVGVIGPRWAGVWKFRRNKE